MKPEYFRHTANSRGYDILYRGVSIGGADGGITRPLSAAEIRKKTALHEKAAKNEIGLLLSGAGRLSMQRHIRDIDKSFSEAMNVKI